MNGSSSPRMPLPRGVLSGPLLGYPSAGSFRFSPPDVSSDLAGAGPEDLRARAAARLQAMRKAGAGAEQPLNWRYGPDQGRAGEGCSSPRGSGFRAVSPGQDEGIGLPRGLGASNAPAKPGSIFGGATGSASFRATSPRSPGSSVRATSPRSPADGGLAGTARSYTVFYAEGELPMADFIRFDGGQGLPVIVGALLPSSKAWRMGVRQGHALVSLNGCTEFKRLPGHQVKLLLEPPIALSFDSAPPRVASGMASSEVRLAPSPSMKPLGLPSGQDLCRQNSGESTWVVAEEVCFQPHRIEFDDPGGRNPPLCWEPQSSGGSPLERISRALSPDRYSTSNAATARSREDRSPLRWVFEHVSALCNDDSDDVANHDAAIEGTAPGDRRGGPPPRRSSSGSTAVLRGPGSERAERGERGERGGNPEGRFAFT